MKNKSALLLAALFLFPFLANGQDKSAAFDSLRIDLNDVKVSLKSQQSEVDILHEKIGTLQASVEGLKEQPACGQGDLNLEKEKVAGLDKRLATLEKNQKTLLIDLKTLKDSLNESSSSLAKCQSSLKELESSVSGDIKGLKTSLSTMLALLEGRKDTSKGSYIVKPGDSLGKIAQDHRVSLKDLRELNELQGDQIVVGQKLQLPTPR